MADAVPAGTLVVSATKGIETDTLALMSQVFGECWPHVRYAALSGPSSTVSRAWYMAASRRPRCA